MQWWRCAQELLEGSMLKRGTGMFVAWKERLFLLTSKQLLYFEDGRLSSTKGSILLRDVKTFSHCLCLGTERGTVSLWHGQAPARPGCFALIPNPTSSAGATLCDVSMHLKTTFLSRRRQARSNMAADLNVSYFVYWCSSRRYRCSPTSPSVTTRVPPAIKRTAPWPAMCPSVAQSRFTQRS